MGKTYYVYIMMNKWNTTSYIGVTSKLDERISQHKNKVVEGFTKKYNINKLVYYEPYDNVSDAITREKQLKKWSRKKKVDLIRKVNPKLNDLSQDLML
ncbi:GIY-YIG nuclease family protein [Candidatus Parcubacteria bacterium]|nr:MAG: GIY-YIG nuclease family protein [Candidatus Parcubacteria bacterium]